MRHTTRPHVLWVEDSARFELSELLGPVYYSRKCFLTLAEDATSAVEHLNRRSFDALIVDIRLPPGSSATWRDLYRQAGKKRVEAQLGLHLLEWLLAPATPGRWNGLPSPQFRLPPERIAVFSVESWSQVQERLKGLGITRERYYQKAVNTPDDILVRIIEQLLG